MSQLSFWFGLIRAAPALVALLKALADQAAMRAARGEGYDDAIAAGLAASHAGLMAAIAAGQNAKDDPEFEEPTP